MSVMQIVCWPDPRLTTMCDPVGEITPDIETLSQNMLETMYAAPGRGLAAPQVGVLKRVFVMDTDWKEGTRTPQVFINPELLEMSDTAVTRVEGCLSIPDISTEIARPGTVRLRWTDLFGVIRERDFEDFAAACVQHELDHLNGVLTLDRLDEDQRARVLTILSEVTV